MTDIALVRTRVIRKVDGEYEGERFGTWLALVCCLVASIGISVGYCWSFYVFSKRYGDYPIIRQVTSATPIPSTGPTPYKPIPKSI